MKITISGTAGSGKGSVSDALANKYGLAQYDLGNMRRAEAKKRGMSISEFNAWSEEHPDEGGDKYFDALQTKIGKDEDNFIFVGRLSWHFIPDSFKIYLDVREKVAAERILKQSQKHERVSETYTTNDEAYQKVVRRNESDVRRYSSLYGINHTDKTHYDLVIDTSELTIEDTTKIVCDALKKANLV